METICYSVLKNSRLGNVFVASTKGGICMVDFRTSEKAFLQRLKKRFPGKVMRDDQKK